MPASSKILLWQNKFWFQVHSHTPRFPGSKTRLLYAPVARSFASHDDIGGAGCRSEDEVTKIAFGDHTNHKNCSEGANPQENDFHMLRSFEKESH